MSGAMSGAGHSQPLNATSVSSTGPGRRNTRKPALEKNRQNSRKHQKTCQTLDSRRLKVCFYRRVESERGPSSPMVGVAHMGQDTTGGAMEQLVTITEFAEVLAVSRSTAYRLLKRHDIPVVRLLGSVRIRQADIERFVDGQAGPLS